MWDLGTWLCQALLQGMRFRAGDSIEIPAGGSFWTKLRIFLGPGLMAWGRYS